MKAVANCLLVDVETWASTRMEELEWQIMLQQFIASGVVVKNEVIIVDSD
jgi:hypothetical protein